MPASGEALEQGYGHQHKKNKTWLSLYNGGTASRTILRESFAVRNRISLSEVVGETQRPEGRCEVCTSADGLYEEGEARLIVK